MTETQLTYDEFDTAIDALIDAIDGTPTEVISLNRGGLPVGTAFAYRLDIDHGVASMNKMDESDDPTERNYHGCTVPDLPTRHLLIVDDFIETGGSMAEVVDRLEGLYDHCTTAVLHVRPSEDRTYSLSEESDDAAFTLDHYYRTIDADETIVYPWE